MKKTVLMGLLTLSVAPFSSFAQAPVSDLGQGSVDSRLATIERIINARNKAQLEMQQQLDTLQDEVNEMRGVTETHSYKLEQMLQRQRELYQEIDRRMSSLQAKPALPVIPEQTQQEDYSGTLSENDAYDRAVNLILRDKRYDQAIPEFEAFLTNFPESSYVPNALYWLGQLYFNKTELAQAKQHFNRLVNAYPDSNKRADALLKLGMVAQSENDLNQARSLYQQLISEYPDSASANLARSRLQSL